MSNCNASQRSHSQASATNVLRGVCLLAIAVLISSAVLLTPTVHAQPQTTAPTLFVNIKVTLTDTRFVLSRHDAPRGTYARFIIHNIGKRSHAFTLGKAHRGTGRQSGFTRTLRPGARKILLLFLDYRSTIPYHGSLAADRMNPRMKGTFTIGKCVASSVGC
jgi:hypothetical protein